MEKERDRPAYFYVRYIRRSTKFGLPTYFASIIFGHCLLFHLEAMQVGNSLEL